MKVVAIALWVVAALVGMGLAWHGDCCHKQKYNGLWSSPWYTSVAQMICLMALLMIPAYAGMIAIAEWLCQCP